MRWSMAFEWIAAVLFLITPSAAEPSAEKNQDAVRKVPLSEIVATSSQTGLQSVRDVLKQKGNAQTAEDYLRQFISASNGSSNVFLVEATNIYDALDASSSILLGSRSADTPAPVTSSQPTRGSYWLVVYIGVGPSTPTWWTVESVTVKKGEVVLTYRTSKPQPATADLHPYYYWIPIGKLPPGSYEVKLFDAERTGVALMRRVEVTSK